MKAEIPLTSVFAENGKMAAGAVGKLWQSSGDDKAAKNSFDGETDPDEIEEKLKAYNIFQSTAISGRFYYSAKTITNQPFVIEIRVKGDTVYSSIKSAALSLSKVLNEELESILA